MASYGFAGKGTILGGDTYNPQFSYKADNIFKNHSFVVNDKAYEFKKFSPFDWGAKVGIDYNFNKFRIRLQGSFSAINLSKYDKKMSNTSLELSVGYTF